MKSRGFTGARLAKLRDSLRGSLWFVPALSVVAAFAGAKALVFVDGHIQQERQAWFLFGGEAESARQLLSTIATSMMTFIALVFSITILVLQLASGQFSPRVLRTFLEDRNTKLAMGAFVGTFVFAMALFPEVRSEEAGRSFVPALSLFVAFLLILLSVGVFIRYIDHMAHSVRAITIIKRVAAETRDALHRMYPEDVLETQEEPMPRPTEPPSLVVFHDGPSGVVTAIDEAALMEVACGGPALMELVPMPGDFVAQGAPLFRIWGRDAVDRDAARNAVAIEDERTPHQDPAFGFRQLVDIAERALSPGINDPSTAVQVLDELHDLLRLLARRRFPSPLRVDGTGTLRLILPRPDWPAYVRLAFDEIRQYGGRSIQVERRMRAAIEDCLTVAPPARRAVLEEERRLLDEATSREIASQGDRDLASKPSPQGHGQS